MTDQKVVAIVAEEGMAKGSYVKLLTILLGEINWETSILSFPDATELLQPNDETLLPDGVEEADALIIIGMGSDDWFVNHLEKLDKLTLYATTLGYPRLDLTNLGVVTLPCPAEDVVGGFTEII